MTNPMTTMGSVQTFSRAASHHCRRFTSSGSGSMNRQSSSLVQTNRYHQPQQCSPLYATSFPSNHNIRRTGYNMIISEIMVAGRSAKFSARSISSATSKDNDGTDNNKGIANNNTIIPKIGDKVHTYAVAIITSNAADDNVELSSQSLSIPQIFKEIKPHPRDFFSLSLTSLGDASRKRKAMMSHHYSVKNHIHPWFILPRESQIVMAFGCVRAIINRKSAYIFDAHKPTIKQQAIRISEQLMRKDSFAFRDGEIIFHHGGKQGKQTTTTTTQFELDMVEQVLSEVCTMYSRRIHLYEPIVNSLMDRVTNETFSHVGLHKLVPVKDSLQHFEMNVKGALHCITELLKNDEDMLDLLLTEKEIAKLENRTLPMESHEGVELLLEEYARQLNSTLLEIDYMLQRVQSKQDMVSLSFDAYRNRMIRMNLYLTIGGIALASATLVAGFFGMNVINGYESAEGMFNGIVLGSMFLGGVFLGGCYSYLNGSGMKARTLNNLNQIEVMNRALGDMSALDYSFELMLNEKEPLTRAKFRETIKASEPEGIRDTEVDFLFDLLDYSDNEVIDKNDFNKG